MTGKRKAGRGTTGSSKQRTRETVSRRGAADHFHVRDWKRLQHYTGRTPPWIKVYAAMCLDEPAIAALDSAEKWHVIGLWLLASRLGNVLPNDPAFLRARIGATEDLDLEHLVARGLLERCSDTGCGQRASRSLAKRKRSATPETEAETDQRQRQKQTRVKVGEIERERTNSDSGSALSQSTHTENYEELGPGNKNPPEDDDLPPITSYIDVEPLDLAEDVEEEARILGFITAWNKERPGYEVKPAEVPRSVREAIGTRVSEVPDLERWQQGFRRLNGGWAAQQDFATLSWVVNSDKALFQIMEGKYDTRFENERDRPRNVPRTPKVHLAQTRARRSIEIHNEIEDDPDKVPPGARPPTGEGS